MESELTRLVEEADEEADEEESAAPAPEQPRSSFWDLFRRKS